MFVVDCAHCGLRRMLPVQRLRAMRNLAPGVILVELACYCGEPAILVTGSATGSPSHTEKPVHSL